jgi:hypothetical protein
MELGFLLGGLFVLLVMIYIAVAIFAPEWVGIQGKIAKDIESAHRTDKAPSRADSAEKPTEPHSKP